MRVLPEARRARSEGRRDLGIDAEIVKVTDIAEIMGYGVMSTPALVIDEELKVAGRVPSYDDVVTILQRSAS